jgi:hypothetical protein
MAKVSDRGSASDREIRYQAILDQTPSEAVVSAVAALSGASASGTDDPTAFPPLYEVVDTDALNALFERAWDSDASDVSVTFRYADCVVTVEGGGQVTAKSAE